MFGTICVLDRERNDHALLFREGLQAFAGVVEANLRSLVELAERRRLETALQQSLDQTARHVVERTSELQDANTALRVLLGNVEQSNEARNEQLLQQIETLVMPHVAKLARLVERDRAAVEYVRLIETHLQTLTSSLSSRMARVFQALTATEADVAHLVMRGLTTKDIAATLWRCCVNRNWHRALPRVGSSPIDRERLWSTKLGHSIEHMARTHRFDSLRCASPHRPGRSNCGPAAPSTRRPAAGGSRRWSRGGISARSRRRRGTA